MKLSKIPKQGTTVTRKQFWDDTVEAVFSSRKLKGTNTKVSEFDGYGTIIEVTRERGGSGSGSGSGSGACCVPDVGCSIHTYSECLDASGLYLGDNTDCVGVDCDCCPIYARFTQVHFSAQVIGCDGGTINLPEKTWTRVASGAGCDVNVFEFATDANCGCQFQAQNCFPFVETDYVAVDEIGNCDDPNSYNGCLFLAHINCDGTVTFEGGTNTPQCCNVNVTLGLTSPYDLTSGSVDVTLSMGSGVSVRLMLSLS